MGVNVRVINWEPRLKRKRRSGGINPRILSLGTWRRWVVSLTPWLLSSLQYPFDRPGGTNSHSGGFGLETNRLRLPTIEPRFLDIPSCSLVIIGAKSRCIVLNRVSKLVAPLPFHKLKVCRPIPLVIKLISFTCRPARVSAPVCSVTC